MLLLFLQAKEDEDDDDDGIGIITIVISQGNCFVWNYTRGSENKGSLGDPC